MNIDSKMKAVIDRFDFEGELADCQEIKNGHVHRSYHLTFATPGGSREYVLQHMNTFAFTAAVEPDLVSALLLSKTLGAAVGAALALAFTGRGRIKNEPGEPPA